MSASTYAATSTPPELDAVHVTLRPGQRLVVTYAEPAEAPAAREHLSLDDLSLSAGVSVRSLRGLIARGTLPARKVGRSYVVRRDDADAVLAPKVATPVERTSPQSPNARAAAQLERSGIRLARSA